MKVLIKIILTLTIALNLLGCGNNTPLEIKDEKLYSHAVKEYLRKKTMDLNIEKYKSFKLSEDGKTAEATISLSNPAAGPRTRFQFTFLKVDGTWEVSSHIQK